MPDELLLPAFLLPLMMLALRGLEREPRDSAWLIHSLQLSLVLGAVGWSAFKIYLLVQHCQDLLVKFPEYREVLEVFLINVGPIVVLVGVACLLVRFAQRWHYPAWFCSLAAGCLALQGFYFAFPETGFYREHCTHYRADLLALRAMVHRDCSRRNRCRPSTAIWAVWITSGSICTPRVISTGGRRAISCIAATWPWKDNGVPIWSVRLNSSVTARSRTNCPRDTNMSSNAFSTSTSTVSL